MKPGSAGRFPGWLAFSNNLGAGQREGTASCITVPHSPDWSKTGVAGTRTVAGGRSPGPIPAPRGISGEASGKSAMSIDGKGRVLRVGGRGGILT